MRNMANINFALRVHVAEYAVHLPRNRSLVFPYIDDARDWHSEAKETLMIRFIKYLIQTCRAEIRVVRILARNIDNELAESMDAIQPGKFDPDLPYVV
jgi:hypothetical protein